MQHHLPARSLAIRIVTTPLLFLRDIHLTFGVTPLLEGADLSVAEGERLCLVGRNGSGKSTLLKIAAGLGGGRPRDANSSSRA